MSAGIAISKTADCWILVYSLIAIGLFLIVTYELSDSISNIFWNSLSFFSWIKKLENKGNLNNDTEIFAFTSSVRTRENFILNNEDPGLIIPPEYNSEYEHFCIKNRALPLRGFFAGRNSIMISKRFMNVTGGSLGIAMIFSAWSTFIWLLLDYDHKCTFQNKFGIWCDENSDALARLVSDFAFYPIFLLVA